MNAPRHSCHVLGVCQGGPRQVGCTCDSLPPPLGEGRGGGLPPFAPGVLQRWPSRRRTRLLRALHHAALALLLLIALAAASGVLGYLLG